MAAGATTIGSTSIVTRQAWLKLKLDGRAVLERGEFVSIAKLDGSIVGISIVSV